MLVRRQYTKPDYDSKPALRLIPFTAALHVRSLLIAVVKDDVLKGVKFKSFTVKN